MKTIERVYISGLFPSAVLKDIRTPFFVTSLLSSGVCDSSSVNTVRSTTTTAAAAAAK
jgi:hypothetical protein